MVTEYSWDSGSCDPCPEPPLTQNELATLGTDVLAASHSGMYYSFVLTRLHARYSAKTLGEDLIFKAASPIAGGREFMGGDGLERGSKPAGQNNFQGRYAIRHEWEGKIECESPVRGVWGGPPSGTQDHGITPATDLAFAPRGGMQLANVIAQDIPDIGVKAAVAPASATKTPATKTPATEPAKGAASAEDTKSKNKSKGCNAGGTGTSPGWALALVALLWWQRRKRSEVC